MKPSTAAKTIDRLITERLPFHLWGGPGIGKSDIIKQSAARLNRTLFDCRVSLHDPVDFLGIPSTTNGRTTWNPPDWLPSTDEPGILFLDELNSAPPAVQASCYQLILDRRLGAYRLPDQWAICAAGNRAEDRAVTYALPAPLANRFAAHIDITPDLADWLKWATAANINPLIAAYLTWRPEALQIPPREDEEPRAFPTPRSWAAASRLLDISADLPRATRHELFAGCIGPATAAELEGFIRIYDTLPNIDGILANPATAAIPSDPATLYALAGALAAQASAATAAALVTYAARLADAGSAEYAVVMIQQAAYRYPNLAATPGFPDFVNRYPDIMGLIAA